MHETIDFPSVFTSEQLAYVSECVVEAARQLFGEKLRDVILYGSYARGDHQEYSDVDYMILADVDDDESHRLKKAVRDTLFDLIYRMNLLLSIIITPYERFAKMKNIYPLYRNVDKEGVRLCSTKTA
jgi:predicted nucleotidyltransferase